METERTFVLARHGYRSTNNVTPQAELIIGPGVIPSVVHRPSFGAAFAENLLNRTLSHTLPCVVKATLAIVTGTHEQPKNDHDEEKPKGVQEEKPKSGHCKKVHPKKKRNHHIHPWTYADSSVSRCQQTAVGWAIYTDAKSVWGVPTPPETPADPRVNHRAAEINLDPKRWLVAQKAAAVKYGPRAHRLWRKLLEMLGFDLAPRLQERGHRPTSERSEEKGTTQMLTKHHTVEEHTAVDGRQRALMLLGLPLGTFDFATTVIMSFGVVGKTAPEILKEARWPKPRLRQPCEWFRTASQLLGTILAVWYPKGYVADTMAVAVARLSLRVLKHGKGETDEERELTRGDEDKEPFFVAVSHEEHLNFYRSALGLGATSYAVPTSCLVLRLRREDHKDQPGEEKKAKKGDIVEAYIVQNRIRRDGSVSPSAVWKHIGDVPLKRIKKLAKQHIAPLPKPIRSSIFGHGGPPC